MKIIPRITEGLTVEELSPTRRRLIYGAYWNFIASTIPRLITIVASFLLARILGREIFGEYGMISSTLGMVSSFSGLGLGSTIIKHLGEYKSSDPEKAGRIFSLITTVNWISALFYAITLIIFAPWLASKTLAAPHLTIFLQISSISLAMGTINSLQQNVMTGFEAFRSNAFITVTVNILQSIILVLSAFYWMLSGVIIALALNSIIIGVAYFIIIKNERQKFNIQLMLGTAKYELPVLFKYSLPAFLGGILVGPTFWFANALLANQVNGYSELGLLSAANQWQQVIQFIPGVLGAAVLPIMSERYGNGDQKGTADLMWKMILFYTIIIIPTAIMLSLLSPLIMKGYGKSFIEGSSILVLLVASSSIVAIIAPVSQFLAATGKMWIGFLMNLGWAFCIVIFSILFVNKGAKGIAGARLLAYLIHAIWTIAFIVYYKPRISPSNDS